MKITINEVAAAAGVSIKTVSRVLNQEPNVSAEKRRMVEQVCMKLNYKPNPFARSLAGQRSYVVSLVYDNPSSNYMMEVQRGVLEACRANHYNLVLTPVSFSSRRFLADVKDFFANIKCDGIILIPPLTDDARLIDFLNKRKTPFACISPLDKDQCIGATLEESEAVFELISLLIAKGHRHIGHIMGHPAHGACKWRLAGYRDALRHAGIAFDNKLVVPGEFTFESGVRGANALLDLPSPPTAIFAANDDMAAGVICAAYKRGLVIPKDLSVCGFDDTPISRNIYPALTTIRQPTCDMGTAAMQELLKEIRKKGSGTLVSMPYSLQIRDSIEAAALSPVLS